MKPVVWLLAALALAQQSSPKRVVLIAYHSETGNTEKLAQAIAKGASGAAVLVRKVTDVKDEEILNADGIVVGTPVQWSNLSADTKRFLDRVGAVLWKAKRTGDGRMAGAFCTGGGVSMGKDNARLSILSAFLTMRFTVVGGVDPAGFGTMGPCATTGPDDPGIGEKELEEARRFGERFTQAVLSTRARARP